MRFLSDFQVIILSPDWTGFARVDRQAAKIVDIAARQGLAVSPILPGAGA
jgi:hypothetical protein